MNLILQPEFRHCLQVSQFVFGAQGPSACVVIFRAFAVLRGSNGNGDTD